MIFNFIIAAVTAFAEGAAALYAAAVNNVALTTHLASAKTLSIATAVKVGKAVVGGVIAYGLYQLGKPDLPQREYLSGRKQFKITPNPRRVVVYGKCWLSPAVVSQCSTSSYLYLIAAVADHKLKELSDLKVFDQPFLTNQEKTDLKNNRWVMPGDGGEEISDWRKLVVDRKSGTGLAFAYGFNGEELQEDLKEGGTFDSDDNDLPTPWRAGTGEGAPVDKLNFRMVGTSWLAMGIERTGINTSNYWNQIPNISIEVERGNANLDVRFLFPRVDIRAKALNVDNEYPTNIYTKDSTELIKEDVRAAFALLGEDSDFIDLEFKKGDDDPIPQWANDDTNEYDSLEDVKVALFADIVSNYYTEGNAALSTADFLKRYTAYKDPICGALRIDRESALKAAQVCEDYIDAEGNSTPLTADGAMPINRPDAVLTQLTMAMNSGAVVESGGIRYIHAGAKTPATLTYTDDEVLRDETTGASSISFSRTSEISRRTSLMNVHYIDEEGLQRMAGVRAVDFHGNLLKRTTISGMELNFIKNRKQAEQVARVAIDRQWNSASVVFSLLNTYKVPRPYDMVQMDVSAFDTFAQKNFRVVAVENGLGGVVRVQGVWEDDDLYTATEASDYTVLPTPDPEPGPSFFIFDDFGIAPIGDPITRTGDFTTDNILIYPASYSNTERDDPADTKAIGAGSTPAGGAWGDKIRIN